MELMLIIAGTIVMFIVIVGIIATKMDNRNRYQRYLRYLEMLPPGTKQKTYDEWKAHMERPKTDHNRYPSSSDGSVF